MPPAAIPGRPRRLAWFSVVVCLLALTAAGLSFARGSFLGVIWILLAGLSSNMAWYYLRKSRSGAGRA